MPPPPPRRHDEEVLARLIELQAEVRHIKERVDLSHKLLTGNGDPASGISLRLASVETSLAAHGEARRWAFRTIVGAALVALFSLGTTLLRPAFDAKDPPAPARHSAPAAPERSGLGIPSGHPALSPGQ